MTKYALIVRPVRDRSHTSEYVGWKRALAAAISTEDVTVFWPSNEDYQIERRDDFFERIYQPGFRDQVIEIFLSETPL